VKKLNENEKKNQPEETVDNPRREFLKISGAGLAAAGIAPAVAGLPSAARAESNGYDVVVVGGGFAGVTAARDSSNRGLKTLLLEARPRLGGRTFTTSFDGHDVDLGGTWIRWAQPSVWAEMSRYGLEVTESAAASAEQNIWMEGDNRVVGSYAEWAEIYGSASALYYEPAREYLPRPFDPLYRGEFGNLDKMTAREAVEKLDLTSVQKDLMLAAVAIMSHAPSDKSSHLDQLRWYALSEYNLWNMWDNISRYRVAGGTKALIDQMAADGRFETRLGEPVSAISQDGEATVTTKRGEQIRTRKVIVALPLNCIQDVQFSPAISKVKLDASREGHTGSGTKVYMRTKGKHPVFLGHGKEEMPLTFGWTEYNDPEHQILCGFGASPSLLDVYDDDAVQGAFQRFMPDAELSASISYDWNLDPYSKGTWCMFPPGMLTNSLKELQRPEGNVYFAGGDIANGWRGFIDGAIESGAAVARQVNQELTKKAV